MKEGRSAEEIVRRGYDLIAERYSAERDRFQNERHLGLFTEALPPPATVLDLGCGAGVPVDRFLVDRGYRVTGIDISPRQIELARQVVPEAEFTVRDMLDIRNGDYAVDGVVSLYAIFHTSRAHHGRLLKAIASLLPPGGVILLTMGADAWQGTEPDFHGAEMYWSHFAAAKNRELAEGAGFVIDLDEIDPSAGERHQVVLAHRESSSGG